MPFPFRKRVENEINHPHIVGLAVVSDGVDVELSQLIIQFHKSRHIQLRHGRRITTRRGKVYRWCFSDLLIACTFAEQFNGELA
jgi:hypothetical protein